MGFILCKALTKATWMVYSYYPRRSTSSHLELCCRCIWESLRSQDCSSAQGTAPQTFIIGNEYYSYCEILYQCWIIPAPLFSNDPLWDGEQCEGIYLLQWYQVSPMVQCTAAPTQLIRLRWGFVLTSQPTMKILQFNCWKFMCMQWTLQSNDLASYSGSVTRPHKESTSHRT